MCPQLQSKQIRIGIGISNVINMHVGNLFSQKATIPAARNTHRQAIWYIRVNQFKFVFSGQCFVVRGAATENLAAMAWVLYIYIPPPPHSASNNGTTTCGSRVNVIVGGRKRPPVQVTDAEPRVPVE